MKRRIALVVGVLLALVIPLETEVTHVDKAGMEFPVFSLNPLDENTCALLVATDFKQKMVQFLEQQKLDADDARAVIFRPVLLRLEKGIMIWTEEKLEWEIVIHGDVTKTKELIQQGWTEFLKHN